MIAPLVLLKKITKTKDSKKISEGIYNTLISYCADKKVKEYAVLLNKSGFYSLAQEQGRIWDLVMEILNQLATTLGEIDLKTYAKMFSLIISCEDLGTVPSGIDNVQIGQADRIRTDNPKAVFVLGANEGEFPQSAITSGLLSEAERRIMLENDFKLYSYAEIFNLQEMIEAFDIKGISKSPAIFDPQKLDWLNGEYIRKLTPEAFYEKALPYLKQGIKREDIDLAKVAKLLHDRCEKLSDIPEQLDFIDVLPDYEPSLYCHKKMKTNEENSLTSLQEILPVLESVTDWQYDALHEALFALIEKLGVKNGLMLWPLRVAVSGKSFTPGGGVELAEILGKDETIKRIKHGIALLEK